MNHRLAMACVGAACVLSVSPARAGPFSDELGKCLVRSTTREDREALLRWMFTALAKHPAVRSLLSVSKAQSEAANKAMGEMVTRLLTTSCKNDTKRALRYEGVVALQTGFRVLGTVAGRELMGNPDVAASFSAMEKYMDTKRVKALANDAASAGN